MSTKSIRNLLIALAALLIGFVLLVTLTEKSPGEEELGKYLALEVSEDNILYYHDSHGGFFGDGETVAVFTASDKNAALIGGSWSSEFKNEQALEILFGEGGVLQSRGFTLPENGLYYFEDGGRGSSVNFVFAVYDTASRTVYYCRFDT